MLRNVIELTATKETPMTAYSRFLAGLAEIEAAAAEAPTWEQAQDFISRARGLWEWFGELGAWRWALNETTYRICGLELPITPLHEMPQFQRRRALCAA